MRSKRAMSLVLAFGLTVLLCACSTKGENKPGGGQTEDTGGKAITCLFYSDVWADYLYEVNDAFTKETGIKVNMEYYPFDQFFELVEVKLGSGSSDYDVIHVDVPMVAAYTQREYLLSMDDAYTSAEKEMFIDSSLTAGTWDGRLMAPPMETSSQVLYYNKALLDEAGVSYPSPSLEDRLTYEELYELAAQVQAAVDPDGSKAVSGFMFEQVNRPYQILCMPNGLGAPSIGDDGLTVRGILDSPAWVEAMTVYQQAFSDGISLRGITADEVLSNFSSGKVAFMIGGSWVIDVLKEAGIENFGYAPHPCFEGHEPATPTGSWHYGIPAKAKNVDAATQYIRYMTIGAGHDMLMENFPALPATTHQLDRLINEPASDDFTTEVMRLQAYEALNTGVSRPVTPGYTEYENIVGTAMEDISNGADVRETLESAVDQIETAFKKYR